MTTIISELLFLKLTTDINKKSDYKKKIKCNHLSNVSVKFHDSKIIKNNLRLF